MWCIVLHNYSKSSYLYPMQVSEHKIKGKSITVKKADVKPGKVTAQSFLSWGWAQLSGVCGKIARNRVWRGRHQGAFCPGTFIHSSYEHQHSNINRTVAEVYFTDSGWSRPGQVEVQRGEAELDFNLTWTTSAGVARGSPPPTPLKSTKAKSRYNEAKPSCTWTWPQWTWAEVVRRGQYRLHSSPPMPSPGTTRRSRDVPGLEFSTLMHFLIICLQGCRYWFHLSVLYNCTSVMKVAMDFTHISVATLDERRDRIGRTEYKIHLLSYLRPRWTTSEFTKPL